MGSVNLDNTGSGSAITLSSDGTSLLLNGTAIGGGGGATDLNDLTPCVSNTTTDNYGIGRDVLGDITTGIENVAFGALSGQNITTGSANTLYGRNAGRFVTTGSGNVGIGLNAAAGSNLNKVTGDYNVGIGYQAGKSVASTDNNTAIGYNADNSGNPSGSTAIGSEAVAAGSQATALTDSYASGADSFAAAIANNTSSYGATGANSIAMGYLAKATDNNGIALNGGWANSGGCLAWSPNAKASFSRSIALGYNAFSNADNAIALGSNSLSDVKGKIAFSNFTIAPNWSQGSAQSGQYTLGCQTSDATATTMTTDNSASVSSINQVRLHDHEAVAFDILLVARQDGTDGTACAAWKVVGLINRASGAGTTTLVTSATTVINNTPNWGTPALSADTTNGNLKVQVTGAASTDIAWVATVTTSELTHA